MQTSHLVALAVDMPFMTTEGMRVLWDQAAMGCGLLPMIGDRAEPLAAIYPKEVRNVFLDTLNGRQFSLQPLSRSLVQSGKLQIVQISEGNIGLYQSVNEPEDLFSEIEGD